MGCILEQHHVLEPNGRALARDAVGQLDAIVGTVRVGLGVEDRTTPGHHDADVSIGEVGGELGGIEIADVRTDLAQQRLGLLVVLGVLAVRRQAQVVQRDRHDLHGRIEHGHAALAEPGDVLFLEDQVPGIDRRVRPQQLLDLDGVITDASSAPHIGNGVTVARIVHLQLFQDFRVQVRPVTEAPAIQLLEDARLGKVGDQVVRHHHHVIAAAPGHQFAFHHLGIIEGVPDQRRTGVCLEFLGGVRCQEVGPVVQVHAGCLRPRGVEAHAEQRGQTELQ
ncbi:hypothetical protein D3C72_1164220 [compost metagenome]